MKRHPDEHPDENRDEGAGGGQERGACCVLVRNEEFRAKPGPVPGINLLVVTLLARFPDPLNEASRLDAYRSIPAFVW